MAPRNSSGRRRADLVDNLLNSAVSVAIAVIVGIGSSYLTVRLAINTIETKVVYFERDIETLTDSIKTTISNHKDISIIKSDLDKLEKSNVMLSERLARLEAKQNEVLIRLEQR